MEKNKHNDPSANRKLLFETLTVIAVIFATGAAFWQGYLIRDAMRIEQRAWLTITVGEPTLRENEPITAPITLSNSGKTVARNLEGFVFGAAVPATEAHPNFGAPPAEGGGSVRESIRTGIVAPNSPMTMPIVAVTPTGKAPAINIQPVILTTNLRQEIESRRTVLLFYGQITYRDIFGDHHWYHFCTGHGSLSTPASAACAAYNDTD